MRSADRSLPEGRQDCTQPVREEHRGYIASHEASKNDCACNENLIHDSHNRYLLILERAAVLAITIESLSTTPGESFHVTALYV